MPGIIEYVRQELRPFSLHPFGQVDSLVLSQLCYMQLGGLVPAVGQRRAVSLSTLFKAERFEEMTRHVRAPEQCLQLLTALCASPRFRTLRLCDWAEERDKEQEKQFVAVTFLLEDGRRYVAYRGTDADVVGWKEDFNMAFLDTVPAQKAAVQYAARAARLSRGKVMLGGHSKGGNLAAYAAIHLSPPMQTRLEAVYCHDGPGFRRDVTGSPAFGRIADRFYKTVPYEAMVGMLLEGGKGYQVVKSDRWNLWQHDPFSWQVEKGEFVMLEDISAGAKYVQTTLSQWLAALSDDRRRQFIDALFGILERGNIHSFAQEEWDWQEDLAAVVDSVRGMDSDTRKMLLKTLGELAQMAVRNLSPLSEEKPARKWHKGG